VLIFYGVSHRDSHDLWKTHGFLFVLLPDFEPRSEVRVLELLELQKELQQEQQLRSAAQQQQLKAEEELKSSKERSAKGDLESLEEDITVIYIKIITYDNIFLFFDLYDYNIL
jgi:hypothetical protein